MEADELGVLGLCAIAVDGWFDEAKSYRERLERVMRAASALGRRTRSAPKTPSVLLEEFGRPVREWLPGMSGELTLIEDGQPSPYCADVLSELGETPIAEAVQLRVSQSRAAFATHPNPDASYRAFRRFLIEHPVAASREAASSVLESGIPLAELYEELPSSAVFALPAAATDSFFPCPRCRWPMLRTFSSVACRSQTCRAEGAVFSWTEDRLRARSSLAPPAALSAAGIVRLRHGVWRYTLQPGLEELDLERRLKSEGALVELWPGMDRYDLRITANGFVWKVDVKDWSDVHALARRLGARGVESGTTVVIPDRQLREKSVLQSALPGVSVMTSLELVQVVQRHLKEIAK